MINTVQAVLRKLLKHELVEVADIVYSETVLCRSYRAAVSREEAALSCCISGSRQFQGISPSAFVAALLEEICREHHRKNHSGVSPTGGINPLPHTPPVSRGPSHTPGHTGYECPPSNGRQA